MNKRHVLKVHRSPSLDAPRSSLLDAAFVSILLAVAAASFLQIPVPSLNPFQDAGAAPSTPSRIVVWVQPSGRIDVNGHAVDAPNLGARLRELVLQNPALRVDVVARGAVASETLIAALSAAKDAGARGVRVTQLDSAAMSVSLSAADLERTVLALADRT